MHYYHRSILTMKYSLGENMRLNRPRPRGRPGHARTIGPIKV